MELIETLRNIAVREGFEAGHSIQDISDETGLPVREVFQREKVSPDPRERSVCEASDHGPSWLKVRRDWSHPGRAPNPSAKAIESWDNEGGAPSTGDQSRKKKEERQALLRRFPRTSGFSGRNALLI